MSQFEVLLTNEEWKQKLTKKEYKVLRNKETEDMGGKYDLFQPANGFFKCKACDNPLYSAKAKFQAGCGWPAFDKCFNGSIITDANEEENMIEIMCSKCGGHLGHIFLNEHHTDTNERHCVNSISIKYDNGSFTADESKLVTYFKGEQY